MSEPLHVRRDDYLMAARNFVDIYCALTVPDNVPFTPCDYQKEAQQFLEDNLYPEDGLRRAIQKQYDFMLDSLIKKLAKEIYD
jgi:hypothetical protein